MYIFCYLIVGPSFFGTIEIVRCSGPNILPKTDAANLCRLRLLINNKKTDYSFYTVYISNYILDVLNLKRECDKDEKK